MRIFNVIDCESPKRKRAMLRLRFFSLCAVLLLASQAAGRTEFHLGGVDGVPWQTALSEDSPGAYLIFDTNGELVGQLPINSVPQETGADTLIDYEGTSIQPRFIDPTINLALADPETEETKAVLPFSGGEVSVTYGIYGTSTYLCLFAGQYAPFSKKMLDGDPVTSMFYGFEQHPDKAPGVGAGPFFSEGIIFDFKADLPINRIRFYPRLGQEEDALLIEDFSEPVFDTEKFGEISFVDNFVKWFDIYTGDNSITAFSNGPCSRVAGKRWIIKNDPELTLLHSTRENLDLVTDLRFPTQAIRYMMLQVYPLRDWEIAEFEIYGEGYVKETTYIAQILDFGKPISWGKIRWDCDAPKGTRVEIRTRTGNTPDPNLYFAPNVNGDLEQITLAEYMKLDALARLPVVYDVENWSFWSPPYDFKAGLQDESQEPAAWEDGTPLLSPGPSRYIQVAMKFFSAPFDGPKMEQISLQFGEVPSAQEIVGEIWPIEVESFSPSTFTYVVLPTFRADDAGFDRLEILTHTRVDAVSSVMLDGVEVDREAYPTEILDDRIVVAFPALVGEKDSFKQLEVIFDAPVLRFGTEFSSWVFNSDDPDKIKQQVNAGNASFRFSGDLLSVKTPVGGDLLVDAEIGPNPFTPNGDGVNDLLGFSYKLREVSADRPVSVSIFDLAGRLVVELPPILSRSGEFRQEWDGRGVDGELVPPGTYIYKLALDVEENHERMGSFSVAY
jgi:gliding motility-associated-like protein